MSLNKSTGKEWKIDENKETRTRPLYVLAGRGGGGSEGWRERGSFQVAGGKEGRWGVACLNRCPFSSPANPETQLQPCALQQAAEKPPVPSKLRRAIKSSFASELALREDSRYTKTNIGLLWAEKEAASSPGPDPACPLVSQAASHPLHTRSLLSQKDNTAIAS